MRGSCLRNGSDQAQSVTGFVQRSSRTPTERAARVDVLLANGVRRRRCVIIRRGLELARDCKK